MQQQPLQTPYTLAAHDLVAAPAGPSGAPISGSSTTSAGALGLAGDSRKRKAEDPQDAYGHHQRLQQTVPIQNHHNGGIPQQVCSVASHLKLSISQYLKIGILL